MVNIDTRNTPIPGPVTKTRRVARTRDTSLAGNPPDAVQASDRRSPSKDRRKTQRKVLLDLRSGRDRRRARKGQGIDVEV